ncbi:MAG: nicotinate-nucleotide adenylyltransferase [Kiritimatiellia bacterium]|nr:nicotinate-nucleotide adenylyltransferase [Kiritimatiellia bacterium]
MKQRIGILGGTFDPVHLGHLVLAQDALEKFNLDSVWFIPCREPSHKPDGPWASAEDRLAMLEAAIEGDPRFEVSRIELDRPGVSYTIDTIHALREWKPHVEWVFILGADTLPVLHTWKSINDLLSLCEFVTMDRPGFAMDSIHPDDLHLPAAHAETLLARRAVGHRIEVSSTEIRMRLAEGLEIRYLVPDAVNMYIAEHRLYRT